LLVVFVVGRKSLFPNPVTIGEFSLPELSGWKRKTSTSPKSSIVFYYQKHGTAELLIRFGTKANSANVTQKTVQDLQKEETQRYREMAVKMTKGEQKFQWSSPELATLNSIPAVRMRSVTFNSSQTQYIEQWRFIKSAHLYGLTSTIAVPPTNSPTPPTEYQRELNGAMKKIIDSLVD